MGVHQFNDLVRHVGHNIECVTYGEFSDENVALECMDCNEVLVDFSVEDGHDPLKCGCKYQGMDMWSCGHIDNNEIF